jgi:hypothetical protein
VGSTEYHVFEVVDGQQRITTLIILLRAVAKQLTAGDDKKEVEELLVKRDGNLLLLQTNNANQTLFNEYLRTGKIPGTDDVKTKAGGPWDGKLNAGEILEQHVHRIGNLLLLPQKLNSKATRDGFAVKELVFAKSEGLRIVKEVTDKDDWSQIEIEEREKRILEWAKTAWGDLQ